MSKDEFLLKGWNLKLLRMAMWIKSNEMYKMNPAERNKIDLLVSYLIVQRCSVKGCSEKLSKNMQEYTWKGDTFN